MRSASKALFDKAASMAERDVIRRYSGSIYRLECYSNGWILRADGVALCSPFSTKEAGILALDAVAPIS